MSKNVPELRFPEFSDEWEIERLENICSTFKSGTGITSSDITEVGLYPVYGGNGLRGFTNNYTHEGFYFLIGRQGALCGNIKRSFGKAYISEHAIAVQCDENNNTEWLAQRLDYLNLNRLSESSAQPGLAVNKLLRFRIKSPQKSEQNKIASFLSSVDSKIDLLTKKKELMEQYKKGIIQKIFSQEVRFKDDNGNDYPNWEEKKLDDVLLSFRLGGNYSNTLENTGFPLIKMGNISRGKINLEKIEYIASNENISDVDMIQKNDLFFNTRNTLELVGKVAIWREELPIAYYNSNLMCMTFDCNLFMNYYFNSYYGLKELKALATGTTSVAAIYTKDLLKIKFYYPILGEQKKISSFISSIDSKISQIDKELSSVQKFKKGLLQKMFV